MKNLLLICVFAFSFFFPVKVAYAETQILRVVMAIDTYAQGGAGQACKKIGETLDYVLGEAARKNNVGYDRVNIEALKINENNLHQFYAHHAVTAEDTLLFYYCGHGLMHPQDYHIFDATGGRVRRDYIRKIFSFLPAKLKIIATETCSSYSVDSTFKSIQRGSHEVISDLLFHSKGNVDITAASPGQTAWYGDHNEGGVFTNALMDVFQRDVASVDANKDGRASWVEAFPFIKSQANTNFLQLKASSPAWNQIHLAASQDPYNWKLAE